MDSRRPETSSVLLESDLSFYEEVDKLKDFLAYVLNSYAEETGNRSVASTAVDELAATWGNGLYEERVNA